MSSLEKLKDYSVTAANNNTAPPDGWPEGMPPSKVNDSAREMMARLREWYQDGQWINDGKTKTFVSGTQFKLTGSDETAIYSVGRRVEAIGSTTGKIYGTITITAFAADTNVTVVWDSGALQNEILTISHNIIDLEAGDQNATNDSIVVRTSTGEISGTSSASRYSDLAEKYSVKGVADDGTLVVVCPHAGHEVEACKSYADDTVVGPISIDPGFKLNAEGNGVYVGLRGKVTVKVTGKVKKGDSLCTSYTKGHACKANWLIKILRPQAIFGVVLNVSKDGTCLALV